MADFSILVTAVGSTTALSVIKALRLQGEFTARIVGTDIHPRDAIAGSHFCDAFHQVPPAASAEFGRRMSKLCEQEGIDLLIPIFDAELPILARAKEAFASAGTRVIVSESPTIEICNDKLATCLFLRGNGVPAPLTQLADDIPDPDALAYPLFVKPRYGVSSVNAQRVDSAGDFAAARAKTPDLVVQEYLEGDEYTIDVLVDPRGRAIASVPRLRIETKSGVCTKGQTVQNEHLMIWGARIAQTLAISGPANVQGKVNGGRVSFFEVNPRFSATTALTVAAGVNMPLWLLKMARGESAPPGLLPFKSVTMARYWQEVFYPS